MPTIPRVLLLADLAEPVKSKAFKGSIIIAFELAAALRDYQEVATIEVHLAARRGSWRGLPLISMDTSELGIGQNDPLSEFARMEVMYTSLIKAGLTDGYDLVHSLAPVVVPLQILTGQGTPVLQTILTSEGHPAATLPQMVAPPALLKQVRMLPGSRSERSLLNPAVDLQSYRPVPSPSRNFLLCLTSPADSHEEIEAIGRILRLPRRYVRKERSISLLQNALALLCSCKDDPFTVLMWSLRALACGTPVVAWHANELQDLLKEPVGLTPVPGDERALARRIRRLGACRNGVADRRQAMLARYGRRVMAASFCEVYRAILNGRETLFESKGYGEIENEVNTGRRKPQE